MEYRVFSIVIKVANLVRRNFFPCCKIMVFRSIWMEKIGRSIISIWRGYNKMDMKLREKGRVHVQEEVQQGV
jgi:hypothetical protein